jgi:hypothetical protein
MEISIKKFDPSRIDDGSTCIFIGRRRSGKSTLVTDILYQKKHIPLGVVMSGTEEGNHHYKSFVPDLFIHGEFNKGTIEKIIERQKRNNKAPVFLVLDDLMFDRKYMKENCIRQLFFNGRHFNIFFVVTMQDCLSLECSTRGQGDFVFVLKTDASLNNLKRLYDHFFGSCIENFNTFKKIYHAITDNYTAIVIDNTAQSSRMEDRIFYYRAKIRTNFKMGSSAMWNAHNKLNKTSITSNGTRTLKI